MKTSIVFILLLLASQGFAQLSVKSQGDLRTVVTAKHSVLGDCPIELGKRCGQKIFLKRS